MSICSNCMDAESLFDCTLCSIWLIIQLHKSNMRWLRNQFNRTWVYVRQWNWSRDVRCVTWRCALTTEDEFITNNCMTVSVFLKEIFLELSSSHSGDICSNYICLFQDIRRQPLLSKVHGRIYPIFSVVQQLFYLGSLMMKLLLKMDWFSIISKNSAQFVDKEKFGSSYFLIIFRENTFKVVSFLAFHGIFWRS